MFDFCLQDSVCAGLYRESLEQIVDSTAALDPAALATATAEMLAPWQELETDESARQEYDEEEIAEGVQEVLDFIAGRRDEALAWLPPQPPPRKALRRPRPSRARSKVPRRCGSSRCARPGKRS